MSSGPTRGASEKTSWKPRPVLAALMKVFLFAGPFGFSFLVVNLVGPSLYRTDGWVGVGFWVMQAAVVGTVALMVATRTAQQALPAVSLLNMSLVFPDQAPSRFGIALRTGTLKRAQARAREIGDRGIGALSISEDIMDLVSALGHHDKLTRGHTERVRAFADLIGEEMGLDEDERDKLRWAVMLHDIGKMTVPWEVLNKESKLTDEEWETLKAHPARGAEMVEDLAPWLGEWRLAAGQHHERWDGKGYPLGLAGTEISLAGRIVAVADAYDVITSSRSYKKAMSAEAAREELVRCSGGQFDPAVVKAFLNVSVRKVRPVLGPFAWLAEIPGLAPVATTSVTSVGTVAASAAVVVSAAAAAPAATIDTPESLAFTEPIAAEEVVDIPIADAAASVQVEQAVEVPGDVASSTTTPIESSTTTTTTEPPRRAPSAPTTSDAPVTTTTPPATTTTLPPTTTTEAPATTTTVALSPCERAGAGDLALAGLDISSCDLAGQNLSGADFSGANLANANLSGANLAGASLAGANLAGANLNSAILTSANLSNANGAGANFSWSTARGAAVGGLTVTSADLSVASFLETTGVPTGHASATYWSTTCPAGNTESTDCWS